MHLYKCYADAGIDKPIKSIANVGVKLKIVIVLKL